MNDERNYLSTCEAADYLGLSARTLRRYRVTGEGPVFHRFGARVRYGRGDLDAWAAVRRRVSTVDDGSAIAASARARPGPVPGARNPKRGRNAAGVPARGPRAGARRQAEAVEPERVR